MRCSVKMLGFLQCIDFFGCFESVKNGDELKLVGGGRNLIKKIRVGPVPKRPQ